MAAALPRDAQLAADIARLLALAETDELPPEEPPAAVIDESSRTLDAGDAVVSDTDMLGDARAAAGETRPATPPPPPAPPNTRMRAAPNLRRRPGDDPTVGSAPAWWTVAALAVVSALASSSSLILAPTVETWRYEPPPAGTPTAEGILRRVAAADPDADAADLDDGSALTASAQPSSAPSSVASGSAVVGARATPASESGPRAGAVRGGTRPRGSGSRHGATSVLPPPPPPPPPPLPSPLPSPLRADAPASARGERERGSMGGPRRGGSGQASQRTRDKVATPVTAVVAESGASATAVTVDVTLAADSAVRPGVAPRRPSAAAPSASLPSSGGGGGSAGSSKAASGPAGAAAPGGVGGKGKGGGGGGRGGKHKPSRTR